MIIPPLQKYTYQMRSYICTGNYKWGDELDTRKKRLQVLTGIGHEYSLMVGADCPLGNVQQVCYVQHCENTVISILTTCIHMSILRLYVYTLCY